MLGDLFYLVNTGANVFSAYNGHRIATAVTGPGPVQHPQEHPAIRHLRMLFELHSVGLLTDDEANAKAELVRPHLPPWQGGSYSSPPPDPQPASERSGSSSSQERPS
jgi:hypothetical protein